MKRVTPFFSRKNIVLVSCCVLVAYFLLVGAGFIHNKIEHDKRVRALKTQQDKINNLSPAEKAIRKAALYEVHMITSAQAFQRLLFDYLQRSYGLQPELGVSKTPMTIPASGPSYPSELNYLARIAYPDNVIKVAPKDNPESISFTNIYAANCDNLPLPPNFWQIVEEEYQAGKYYLTHDALALFFMKDNGCALPTTADILSAQITTGMVNIVKDPTTIADLRYEAIAFLQLTGHRDLIKSEWIDQIIQEQMPDGSWSAVAGSKKSDDHSTLLALWALLQYSRPEVKYQPLIRHPSVQQ